MKELYKSPVITVEDLTKADVLCASTETSNDATTHLGQPDIFSREPREP